MTEEIATFAVIAYLCAVYATLAWFLHEIAQIIKEVVQRR